MAKSANSVSNAPIAPKPLPISSQLIAPKSLTADANINMEDDRITIPMAVPVIFLSNLTVLKNIPSSVISAPIAISPLVIPSTSIDDTTFNAPARISSETLIPPIMMTALVTPFIPPPIFENMAKEPISSPKSTVIAPRELANVSPSMVEMTNIAAARIPIAEAILRRDPALSCS